jgi:hypothetical protein
MATRSRGNLFIFPITIPQWQDRARYVFFLFLFVWRCEEKFQNHISTLVKPRYRSREGGARQSEPANKKNPFFLRFARPDGLACVLLPSSRPKARARFALPLLRVCSVWLCLSRVGSLTSLARKAAHPSPRHHLSVALRPTRWPRKERCRLAQESCQPSRHSSCFR